MAEGFYSMFGSWGVELRWGGVGLVGDVVGVGHEVVDEAVEIWAFQEEGVFGGAYGIHWGKGFKE